MAVGAQQDAFHRLLTCLRNRARNTTPADREALCIRVDVMELQRRHAPVVATEHATPARFVDELALYPAAALSDLLAAAPRTAKAAIGARDVSGHTMRRAWKIGLAAPGRRR